MSTVKGRALEDPRPHLSYDRELGALTWVGRRKAGVVAGAKTDGGYLRFRLRGRYYLCHRVVWFFETGEWPSGQIDHINRDTTDNRIGNLRVCNTSENKQKLSAVGIGRSKMLGVKYREGRPSPWVAQINVRGSRTYLGAFKSPGEAHEAYVEAKRRLHPFGRL